MMNPFIIQMINFKINQLTPEELVQLTVQHQVPVTMQQAKKIVDLLKTETIDVSNKQQIERMINKLQQLDDPYLSSVMSSLLNQFGHLL